MHEERDLTEESDEDEEDGAGSAGHFAMGLSAGVSGEC